MKFTEVASRLTGFSCPIFGISWDPPEVEVIAARRVIAFLEDRRVLYSPTEMEIPEHCVESILKVRAFLTDELGKLDAKEHLAQNLTAMRAACRKFLDSLGTGGRRGILLSGPIGNMGSYQAWVFCSALGELRGVFGLHIAQIAARNGLDVEDGLATILPGRTS